LIIGAGAGTASGGNSKIRRGSQRAPAIDETHYGFLMSQALILPTAPVAHGQIPLHTQFDGGENFTCGIKLDGSANCWAYNANGQATGLDGDFMITHVAPSESIVFCRGPKRGYYNG
jgi:hypothetical protein